MPVSIRIDDPEEPTQQIRSDGDGSLAGTHHSPHSPSSLSEASDHRDSYVHVALPFPNEIPHEVPDDIHPSDSASESQPRLHRRHTAAASRAPSGRRSSRRRVQVPPTESPESLDFPDEDEVGSELIPESQHPPPCHGPRHMLPMPQYAPSSSSGGTYIYPHVHGAPSGQMVHYGAPPPNAAPAPYGQQFPQMGNPAAPGFPPPQPYPVGHHSGSHYGNPAFPGQSMMVMPSASMYYPPQYPGPYPPAQPWGPYPRGPQPPPAMVPETSASPVSSAGSKAVDNDEVYRRFEAMFLAEKKEREAKEAAREATAKAAADEALAKAERAASDARIAEEAAAKAREEAKKEAEAKAAEEIAKARAEVEAKTKQTVAEAERAEHEAKIVAEAAAKAREEVKKEAEAQAAADAAKAQAEAEAKAERAVSDAKIAEEAAAKAKKEMEEAAAAAAAAAIPQERKNPIKFKDALGRKFNFPFHLCAKWHGMENLIRQAFVNAGDISLYVDEGRYDLLGPNGEIILPQVWDTMVEPDWTVTMHMWKIPEPPKPKTPPLVNLDEILPSKKGVKKGAKKPHRTHVPVAAPAPQPPPPPPHPPAATAVGPPLHSTAAMFAGPPLDGGPPPPPPVASPVNPGINVVNATAPLDLPLPSTKEVDKPTKKAGAAKPGVKKGTPSSGLGMWLLGGKPAKPASKGSKGTKKTDGAAVV